jgi:hypothetical protein
MNPILPEPLKPHKGNSNRNVEVYLSGRNPTWTGLANIKTEKGNYFYGELIDLQPFILDRWRLFQRVLEE